MFFLLAMRCKFLKFEVPFVYSMELDAPTMREAHEDLLTRVKFIQTTEQ